MDDHFKAVIFDLDGVITDTAQVHSLAWKKMFDDYLKERQNRYGEPFKEFTHEKDYLPWVDGKPRYKGVKSFLESRGIDIPFGDPDDPPGKETVCGLGNMKNKAFNKVLEEEGVKVYDSTVELIHELKDRGIRVGVASSSKNCRVVLQQAGLLDLFETRVDGEVSAELGLKGKPEPDIFTVAADNLDVPYDMTVVVEDAVSGIAAGKNGNFGLVLGIARENNEKELLSNGADLVVEDISQIGFDGIRRWFTEGLRSDNFSLTYHNYVPVKEKTRESLLTTGNGYMGTRGAFEETDAGEYNYPGTYIAGLYNRRTSKVADREVENEDFVNCPDWTSITFKIDNGEWFDPNRTEILRIERRLDFHRGLLSRKMKVKDEHGRITTIESERLVSMDNVHLAGLSYRIIPQNYSGKITIRSGLNGAIINDGVERYRELDQRHLGPVKEGSTKNMQRLLVETTGSRIQIAEAAVHRYLNKGEPADPDVTTLTSPGTVYSEAVIHVKQGESLETIKQVAIFTSQPWDSDNPLEAAVDLAEGSTSFAGMKNDSEAGWKKIWEKTDIMIRGDRLAQKLIRMHLYHLMASYSPHNAHFDASIAARGLHGEAYRGHIFWDELFILPLYFIHFPDAAKAALMYRYLRLDEAREYARAHGYSGAMFPWQSGSSGREETQVVHLNPVTGKWGPDHSSLQRHVSLAVAFNTWNYYFHTGDLEFLSEYGAEMFLEICRFWASKARFDPGTGRYSIDRVMGPDEFHEKYPGVKKGGLRDNAYTNIMTAWALEKAPRIMQALHPEVEEKLKRKVNLEEDELTLWNKISHNLRIPVRDDIIAQYDGYFDLKELDWEYYRKKYGNIYRMDRLLKAEGLSADDFKVSKQADTLMTFYVLSVQEVTEILENMNYRLSDDYLAKNLEYYLKRTSHGSTLSRVVHAHLANMAGKKKLSFELYMDALTSDYHDIQGGTTGEGIHTGVMAGTILVALHSYAGLDLSGDVPKFDPKLPDHWRSVAFRFTFQGIRYKCEVYPRKLHIMQENDRGDDVPVDVFGKRIVLEAQKDNKVLF